MSLLNISMVITKFRLVISSKSNIGQNRQYASDSVQSQIAILLCLLISYSTYSSLLSGSTFIQQEGSNRLGIIRKLVARYTKTLIRGFLQVMQPLTPYPQICIVGFIQYHCQVDFKPDDDPSRYSVR